MPPFEFAFDSPHIDWARPADPAWLLQPLAEHAPTRSYNESFAQQYGYCAINNINDESLYNDFLRDDCPYLKSEQCSTIMSVSNRGRTIQMFENPAYARRLKEMELNPYIAFGCLVNFLLQPKPEIFLPVYEQFEIMSRIDPTVLKISIQIRAGDHVFAAESSGLDSSLEAQRVLQHYDTFFSCALQIEQFVLHENPGKYSTVVWYLATESRAIRRAAVTQYGDKIVTSLDSTLEHSSKENIICSDMNAGAGMEHQQCKTVSAEGFAVAAAEWWMLGYADYHVITMSSGYGRSGAYRTLTHETIYTIDKHKSFAECSRSAFTPLEDLMYNWSGI